MGPLPPLFPPSSLTWAIQVFWHFLKRVQLGATKADALASAQVSALRGQLLCRSPFPDSGLFTIQLATLFPDPDSVCRFIPI